jgi:hypothetical protein
MESRQPPRPRRASRAKAVVVLGPVQFGVVGQVEPLARPAVRLDAWQVSLRSTCPTGCTGFVAPRGWAGGVWRNRQTACGGRRPLRSLLCRDSHLDATPPGFPSRPRGERIPPAVGPRKDSRPSRLSVSARSQIRIRHGIGVDPQLPQIGRKQGGRNYWEGQGTHRPAAPPEGSK